VGLEGSAVGEALRSPGIVAVRTGAIEPDITALSLAVGDYSKVQIAISVVGPEHRLAKKPIKAAGVELTAAVDALQRTLGIDREAVA